MNRDEILEQIEKIEHALIMLNLTDEARKDYINELDRLWDKLEALRVKESPCDSGNCCPDCDNDLTPIGDEYADTFDHPKVTSYACDYCGWSER